MADERATSPSPSLARAVGLPGAILLGLGSILGTGVFVSIGIGAGVAGAGVVLAVALAAVVASCNGLSSAQLAAAHPVSGGTYEYGYRVLHPVLGFAAGWMFLCAKSASAAAAALGFAGYAATTLRLADAVHTPVAVAAVVAVTALVAGGIRRSNATNTVIVSLTLLALAAFVLAGLPAARAGGHLRLAALWPDGLGAASLLEATALMFVAYTGYGRIATLGEEVHAPARTIPRAIIVTLVASMLIYVSVAVVGVAAVGAGDFAAATREAAAPLEVVARSFGVPGVPWVLGAGAILAMLGVLLNLVLGLSRVLLAMGRRGDMPGAVARLAQRGATPVVAVWVVGALITALVLIGDLKTTWSFSAFTVLVYYAITNLAALRLPPAARRFPRVISALGLLSCLGLAFWVETTAWLAGSALLIVGLLWYSAARHLGRSARSA